MAVLCSSVPAAGAGVELLTPRELEAFAARLTTRELEVFGQLAAGRDRRGIARILGVSPHTVRTHIQKIFVKLDVHSVIEALALLRAAERGPSNSSSNAQSNSPQPNGSQPGGTRGAGQWTSALGTRVSASTRSSPA
jgi:DNA-binding CsgD family transcriptional regulator